MYVLLFTEEGEKGPPIDPFALPDAPSWFNACDKIMKEKIILFCRDNHNKPIHWQKDKIRSVVKIDEEKAEQVVAWRYECRRILTRKVKDRLGIEESDSLSKHMESYSRERESYGSVHFDRRR